MIEAPPSRARLISGGVTRLASVGVEDAGREAWWIWQQVSSEARHRSLLLSKEFADVAVIQRFVAALERRCGGEPLGYVLGETAFRNLTIACDSRALIPRPETEGLVELVLARRSEGRVLDVGTGTGCIALSLAKEGRYELIVASDLSAEALALARYNVGQTGLPVHLVRGDLGAMARDATFDVVISNPPYLTRIEYEELSPSVKSWEPSLALVSGEDGLDVIRCLLHHAHRVTRDGGLIAIEIDSSRADQARRMAQDAGWLDVTVLDDLFGRARYLLAERSGRTDVG